MATTVQVQDETLATLRRLRETLRLSSYNEVIRYLFSEHQRKKSFWEAGKRKMTMKQILEDLRDETD